jgi:uncharacterized protein (TIGR04552 family)
LNILDRYAVERLGPADMEVLRLIAQGGSVIDWKRLHFTAREEVDRFLRVNLLDTHDKTDVRRMYAILRQAVEYLRKTFRYKVAAPVAEPSEIQDLFLLASGVVEPKRFRRIACVVLKVMHTVHHIEARELLFRTRISEVELSQMVDHRVREAVKQLAQDLPIVAFEGNSKTRESIITKLIAKREHLAAQVYDRHRYRVVVRDQASLVMTVLALSDSLFPFNYVIPGQSQNSLLSLEDVTANAPALRAGPEADEGTLQHDKNEFSGRSYRVLNFVVDLPVRIDATSLASRHERDEDLGRIVFAPVELQVVDELTAQKNEAGENSHARYKKRQLRRVLGRLSRGLVVPKRGKAKLGEDDDT